MAEVRVTTSGAYAELSPQEATRITGMGAYAELSPQESVRLTSFGAYVEILVPPKAVGPLALSGLSGHSAIMGA